MNATLKKLLVAQDNYCFYCGCSLFAYQDSYFSIDHVYPLSHGGERTLINLVGSCRTCNTKKSNKHPSGCVLDKLSRLKAKLICEDDLIYEGYMGFPVSKRLAGEFFLQGKESVDITLTILPVHSGCKVENHD